MIALEAGIYRAKQGIYEKYSTAEFKLDRTRVQQGQDTTRLSFRTCATFLRTQGL